MLLGDAQPVTALMIPDAGQGMQMMIVQRDDDDFDSLLQQAFDELVCNLLTQLRRQVNDRTGGELGESGHGVGR